MSDWEDHTNKVRFAYIGLAVYIISSVLLFWAMNWDLMGWGLTGFFIFFGLTFIFSVSFITLGTRWSYRHGRSRIIHGTFEELGLRLEEFLQAHEIEFDVSVKFSRYQDRETRTRPYGGKARYTFKLIGNDYLILLEGSAVSSRSWMAVEPWKEDNEAFLNLIDELDEAFKDDL